MQHVASPRRIRRPWAVGSALCALIALAALYRPWHRFVVTHELQALSCIGLDVHHCDVDPPDTRIDRGIDHTGPVPALLLGACALLLLLSIVSPGRRLPVIGGAIATVALSLATALTFRATFLAHMLEHTDTLFGETVWTLATGGAIALIVLYLVAACRR